MTGDGRLNVVVKSWSGGAHCCFQYLVFSIDADTVRLIDCIYTGDYGLTFAKRDDAAGFVGITRDDNYVYWHAGYGDAPAPRVIMTFCDGAFRADADLMREPPSPAEELGRLAREIRDSDLRWQKADERFFLRYPDGLHFDTRHWGVTLDLLYSGNIDEAREFFDKAWPEGRIGKQDFAFKFWECHIRRSRHWPTIREMNGLTGDRPPDDCPEWLG